MSLKNDILYLERRMTMASLKSTINVNVPTDVKNEANVIFKLNMSTATFEATLTKDDNLLNYFSKEELDKNIKELNYMEKNADKYKSYNNINDLFEGLESDD